MLHTLPNRVDPGLKPQIGGIVLGEVAQGGHDRRPRRDEARHQLPERGIGEEAPVVRRRQKDHTPDRGHGGHEEHLAQERLGLGRQAQRLRRLVAERRPELGATVDRHPFRQEPALAMPNEDEVV
jgi:hypothetical protein